MLTAFCNGLGIVLLASTAIAHCGDDAFVKWAAAHALPVGRTLAALAYTKGTKRASV